MKQCFRLALKGKGYVSPNPLVGCIIVYNDKIIGKGYHQKAGSYHAEVNAISSVKDKDLLKKSILYVNLEPCNHYGKTPPCSNLIIKHKIPKVVIGCKDTFSKVSGRGIKQMEDSGIEVIVGVLEKESRQLNKRFFTFHEKERPYIILKWAESKDGFIAPHNQRKPFWMTSHESKKLSHQWRAEEDAILVGRITAQKDNPCLTVREKKGINPIRIVIDKNLKLSKDLNLFNTESRTIIFNEIKSEKSPHNHYINTEHKDMIKSILKGLHKERIISLIIEGGTTTLQSFIDKNMWDEARVFITEKKLKKGVKAPEIKGTLKERIKIGNDDIKTLHND